MRERLSHCAAGLVVANKRGPLPKVSKPVAAGAKQSASKAKKNAQATNAAARPAAQASKPALTSAVTQEGTTLQTLKDAGVGAVASAQPAAKRAKVNDVDVAAVTQKLNVARSSQDYSKITIPELKVCLGHVLNVRSFPVACQC
jgi:hypothetical protein